MLISVFGTSYFDSVGIRLVTSSYNLAYIPSADKTLDLEGFDPVINYDKYNRPNGCNNIYVNKCFVWHLLQFENDKIPYDKTMHECFDRERYGCNPDKDFQVQSAGVIGTKIIYGSGISSGRQRDPARGSAAYTDEVYTSSYDKSYFIWFKTQDQVAEEINKQLKKAND